MDEWYQQAIDIVAGDHDWKALCVAIAKRNPKVLCEAQGFTPWQIQARTIYHSQGKVPAIKYIREKTGLGLKEAKEEIESLVDGE